MIDLPTLAIGAATGVTAMAPAVIYALNGWLRLSREHLRTTTDLRDMTAAFKAEMQAHKVTNAAHRFVCGRVEVLAAERDAVQAHLTDALRQITANRPLVEIGLKDRARRQEQNVARKTKRAKRAAA
jgi:hypothetical protein